MQPAIVTIHFASFVPFMTWYAEYTSINNAGILPIVLAILKDSNDILPRAANKVTILDGMKGMRRNDRTSRKASLPST